MATVNVTLVTDLTAHYWMAPTASQSSGDGVLAPDVIQGWTTGGTISADLDPAYAWYIDIRFRAAPPIRFEGFQPGDGGDLIDLLTAQGWASA